MPCPTRHGLVVTPGRQPPRVWRRNIEHLPRRREHTGGLSSRTLYFAFPRSRRASRSQVTFVSPEHVPDFAGEDAWFEMKLTAAVPWSYCRAGAPGRSARRARTARYRG